MKGISYGNETVTCPGIHGKKCREVKFVHGILKLRCFSGRFFLQELLFFNPCHAGMPLVTQENLHQSQPRS